MNKIPITFEYEGKQYAGIFSNVSGSGSIANYHLTIDNFFQGQLMQTEKYGWQFHNNKDNFKGMADYFGGYLVAYIQ